MKVQELFEAEGKYYVVSGRPGEWTFVDGPFDTKPEADEANRKHSTYGADYAVKKLKVKPLDEKIESVFEMAKRANMADFYTAAKKKYGAAAVKDIKWTDVVALARELDVTIPAAAHKNKTGRGRVNLVPDDHADAKAPAKEEPKKAEPKKEEPKKDAPKDGAPTKEELKKMLPDGGDDRYSIDWGVSDYKGQLQVYFSYTFRRNTGYGAYQENKARIERANDFLRKLATKYKDYVRGTPNYLTADEAKTRDGYREQDGEDAYSEYEQSIGGEINFKV